MGCALRLTSVRSKTSSPLTAFVLDYILQQSQVVERCACQYHIKGLLSKPLERANCTALRAGSNIAQQVFNALDKDHSMGIDEGEFQAGSRVRIWAMRVGVC
eukprot:2390366-Amphidinium_carterae.2